MNWMLNVNLSDLLLFAKSEPYSLASERMKTSHTLSTRV